MFCGIILFFFNNFVLCLLPILCAISVVVATTKVRIFKQITTIIWNSCTFFSCCCYHKGTNFQANHNAKGSLSMAQFVVVATTKVRIFKQITTRKVMSFCAVSLLLLPQRYEFSSKSQLDHENQRSVCWLLLLPQRYEFSSKSQHIAFSILFGWVVVATTKVRIFKQITTLIVFIILQFSCCCYHKGTNFQANHNSVLTLVHCFFVVVATTKVRIFKQITTI